MTLEERLSELERIVVGQTKHKRPRDLDERIGRLRNRVERADALVLVSVPPTGQYVMADVLRDYDEG